MEPFIGEIIMFGGNFAPRGWAFCDGQLLPINQNTALYSILGTTYGGDGRTTFGLPDLRGRAPVHAGNGPGLSSYSLGQKGGSEQVTLTEAEMPAHNHVVNATNSAADKGGPGNKLLAGSQNPPPDDDPLIYHVGPPNKQMSSDMIANAGGNESHNNIQPFQVINFIIALVGVFPSRN